jgi:hypothetical protein
MMYTTTRTPEEFDRLMTIVEEVEAKIGMRVDLDTQDAVDVAECVLVRRLCDAIAYNKETNIDTCCDRFRKELTAAVSAEGWKT